MSNPFNSHVSITKMMHVNMMLCMMHHFVRRFQRSPYTSSKSLISHLFIINTSEAELALLGPQPVNWNYDYKCEKKYRTTINCVYLLT